MDQLVTDVRAAQWAQIIAECNASSQSRTVWCQGTISVFMPSTNGRGVSEKMFETIQERKLPAVSFAELPAPQEESVKQKIHIKTRDMSIDLEGDITFGVLDLVKELLGKRHLRADAFLTASGARKRNVKKNT